MKYWTIITTLCAAVTLVGCGGYTATIETRQAALKAQKDKRRSIAKKVKAHERYRSGISGGSGTYLVLGRAEILEAIKSLMPYVIPGKKLWPKRLGGKVTLKNVRNLKVLSGNRIQYVTDFKGSKITVNLKGTGASASHAKKLREALEGGGTVVVTVSLRVDRAKNRVVAKGSATKVTLKRHNSGDNRRRLKDVINKRIFAGAKPIGMPKAVRGKSTRMLTTNNHVILLK